MHAHSRCSDGLALGQRVVGLALVHVLGKGNCVAHYDRSALLGVDYMGRGGCGEVYARVSKITNYGSK